MSSILGQDCAAGRPALEKFSCSLLLEEQRTLLEEYGLPTQHAAVVVGPTRRKHGIPQLQLFYIHSSFGELLTNLALHIVSGKNA